MGKIWIYGIVLLLAVTMAQASSQVILSIPNCYNISIHSTQQTGNTSKPTFDGCSNTIGNDWVCNCNVGTFNLTMHTDNTPLYSNNRWYKVAVTYTQYILNQSLANLVIKDWGDSFNVNGVPEDISGCYNTIYETKYINVSSPPKIVYVDRNVTVTQTVTVMNTTKCDEVETQLVTCNTSSSDKDASSKIARRWYIGIIIFLIFVILYLIGRGVK